jgi:hypothetical protein
MKILLASMKTLTNFKDWPGSRIIIFCTSFPFCHWSIFSSVHLSLDAGKMRVNLHILGTPGMLFKTYTHAIH